MSGWIRSLAPVVVSLILGALAFLALRMAQFPIWVAVVVAVLVTGLGMWLIPRPSPAQDERPHLDDTQPSIHKVGVEIELVGVEVEDVARCVAEEFGGEVERRHDYEWFVHSELGDFRIELDSRQMKGIAQRAEEDPNDDFNRIQHEALRGPAATVVPCEIVTPPLPESAIKRLDSITATLRGMGAQGTHDGLFYAFGVHFNPAIDPVEVAPVCDTLRAFSLLADWLREQFDVDISRDLSPYIKAHPHAYRCLILADDYVGANLSFDRLIDDYLVHNPTRNRDLDMLPLFAHVDEPRVRAVVGEDEKVNPRPTYHYRLPNADAGNDDWTVTSEWSSWLLIRQLAGDATRLERYRRRWWEVVGEDKGDEKAWFAFLNKELR